MATELDSILGVAQEIQASPELDQILGVPSAAPTAVPATPSVPVAPPQGSAQSTVEDDPWQEVSARDPDSFSSAIGRGVDQLQANFGGTIEAVGEATGSEYLAQVGANIREEQQAEAEKYGKPSISSFTQVEDFGDVGSFLKNLGLEALPSLATVGAGGAAGTQAGAPFGVKGRVVGGAIGGLLAGLGINIGDVQNQIKELDPDAKSPWLAIGAGGAMGTLDAVGLGVVARPFIRQFGKETAYQMMTKSGIAKELAADAIKGATVEGATSGAQSVLGNLAAAEGAGVEAKIDQVIENAINATIGGTVAGGGLATAGGVVNAKSRLDEIAGTALQGKKFEEGRTEAFGTTGKFLRGIAGKSTDPLLPLARVAPSAKEFVRHFTPDETGREASGQTIMEEGKMLNGKWGKELDDAEAAFSGSKDDFYEAMADPVKFKALPARDQAAVAKARDTMDNILGEARGAGLKVGFLKDYLPVNLDKSKVTTPEFWQAIRPYYKSDSDVDAAIANYVENMNRAPTETPKISRLVQQDPTTGQYIIEKKSQKGGDDTLRYKFGQGTIPPEFGHLEKSRAFGAVPQSVMLEFSDVSKPNITGDIVGGRGSRIRTALRDYTAGAAHRIAFAKRFGATGEKANAMIAKAVKEAQDYVHPKTGVKGRPVDKAEVNRMYDILDEYNGLYGRIEDPNVKVGVSVLSSALTAATLPLSTLSSLAEVTVPAIRGDVGSALVSLIPAFRETAAAAKASVLKGRPRSEFAMAAAEADLTLASALNVASARLGDNALSKGSAKFNKAFFMVNGNSFFTHFMRTYAAKTAETIMGRNLHALASGLDISSAKGSHMAAQLRSMGIPIETNAQAKAYWDPKTGSLSKAGRAYKVLGMRRFVDQAVLEPDISNTPLWMNNGQLSLFAMLKRYPAAFTNTVLPALFRKGLPSWAGSGSRAGFGAVGALGIASLMVAVGYMQDDLKMVAKTGEWNYDDTRTEGQVFADVMNSTITPLQVSLVADVFASPRYGSDPISSIVGPVGGLAKDTVGVAYVAGQNIMGYKDDPMSGKIAQYLVKRTPFSFYRPLKEESLEIDIDDW